MSESAGGLDGHSQATDPSPCRIAVSESSADDGSKYGPSAPCQTSETDVGGPFVFGGGDRKKGHDTQVHASTSKTTYRTSNDESIHSRGSAANCRAGLKQEDGYQVEVLGIELCVNFTPGILN